MSTQPEMPTAVADLRPKRNILVILVRIAIAAWAVLLLPPSLWITVTKTSSIGGASIAACLFVLFYNSGSREAIEKILVLVVDSTVIILIIQSMSNPLLSCKLAGIANEIDSALSFLKIPCSALPPVTTPPTPPASTSTPPASPVLPPVKTAVSPQSSSNAYYLPLPKLPALRCKLGIDLISEGNAISPDESDAIKDFASSQMIGLPLNDANSAVTIKIVNLSLRHDVADDLINSSAGQYYRVETYLKIADPGDCHVMREALGTGQSHTNYVDITADNDDSVIDAVDAAIQNAILKVNSQ